MDRPRFRFLQWLVAIGLFVAGSVFATEGSGQPTEVFLGASVKTPELHLALALPPGWSVDWYPRQAGPTVARLTRDGTHGAEAIVVIATRSARAAGRTANSVFDDTFLRNTATGYKARTFRRVKNDFWDGAYFQYDVDARQGPNVNRMEIRNWMMFADDYVVQFQCAFLKDFTLEAEARREREEALAQVYREILLSVRAVSPQESARAAAAAARQP